MSQIAIDIAILLPPKVAEAAISFSDLLCQKYGERMHLNTTDCLPHISLVMGVVLESDLEDVNRIVAEAKMKFLPLELEITGVKSTKNSTSLEIERTLELEELQEDLLNKLTPFLSYEPTEEMFAEAPEPKALSWVAEFHSNSTGENFKPHITIGPASEYETYDGPLTFKGSELAICQLGNYCSCKKLLATI